jgi:hypothetical protein
MHLEDTKREGTTRGTAVGRGSRCYIEDPFAATVEAQSLNESLNTRRASFRVIRGRSGRQEAVLVPL